MGKGWGGTGPRDRLISTSRSRREVSTRGAVDHFTVTTYTEGPPGGSGEKVGSENKRRTRKKYNLLCLDVRVL